MSYDSLTLNIDAKIAHIQLNCPDTLNTMTPAFWRELPEVVQHIDREAAARVIVLSSTGKHFCAGMDLSVFTGGALTSKQELGRKHENLRRTVLQLQEALSQLEKVRMPVLAAIQGGCIGGAVDMVTACDSRYCTEDAFFSIEETKLGMTADVGTLQRLPHLIPQGLVRELAYTGRRMYADEAKQAGLINRVYPDQATMLNDVMDIAAQIAARSPLAVTGCKEMINYTRDHSVADSLNYMAAWQSGMFQPETDMMETFMAKAEKREPDFEELNKMTSIFD
ncbi:crotonase/enoyl-CoA hydratase family protein [Aestuariicella hydrocarbonica]|uniref:Crotonase/enoyl-CoA hydratase family protein n=1 Tax=Pseudomaricurvus hydrocarbonicus TaxID=1470433 RepID=A0A9E5JTV7_9GAMM|nr:crotonase/enoyl-CoA hydratase family protein [Aestuariicella hydrocarbonica]NHO65488.1 crotonase/enoyl-CoA hydratase family protein [Aestuariicella hydrocarbonica]